MATPSAVHDTRYSWLRLGITLLIAVVGNVGMWAIIVAMPAIQAEFGVGRADASLPYTTTMVGFAIGNYLIGTAVDRFGIVKSMVLAASTVATGFVMAATANSILVVSAAQLVIGLGTAASFGPLISDISHWFIKRRGLAVAIAASGNYLSGAIWPLMLTGYLAEGDWRMAYFVLAICVAGAVIPLSLLLRKSLPTAASVAADARARENALQSGFSNRTLTALLCVAGIACCIAMSMPQVHIVAYCVDLGYGPAVGAEMLSLMLLGGVGSRIVSGMLADRIGGVRTLLIGSLLQGIALFLFLPFDGLVSLYVISLLFGLSQGGIVPSYAVIVREYLPSKGAASRVGLVMMMTIVGMALGGWISGWIYDVTNSYYLAFLNGIAWNGLNLLIVLALLFGPRQRQLQRA